MYLVDTNIFLEILLEQARKTMCKNFLRTHAGHLHISDFSLHSIGVILLRNGKDEVFKKFAQDVLPNAEIVTLTKDNYPNLIEDKMAFGLDFDDVYQFNIVKETGLTLVTMDKDFKSVQHEIQVMFL